MKKRLFPLLITLAALAVSGSAAFYSVFGLSKLFAGASTQVIIMAGSLEFAKLVVASLLYQYWDTINKWLRTYFMIACLVLMVITSGGIYGFLSGAYQSTATKSELLDKSLLILEQKQTRFEEQKEDLILEKTQINQSISDLRVSLSNPHSVSWFDKNSQTVITSSSGSARRALQAELKTTTIDRDNINLKLEAVLDSITTTDMALLNKEISNEDQRELGPLKYLASTTGWPMDKVVNYFLLLIVFVFDPLAIALVVAANMAFTQIRKPKETVIEEYIDDDFDEEDELIKEITDENDEEIANPKSNYPTQEDIIEFNRKENKQKELEEKTLKDDDLYWEKDPQTITPHPIVPSNSDIKKLEKYLKKFDNKDIERLTDTTQTLIVETPKPLPLEVEEHDVIDDVVGISIEENKENLDKRLKSENAHRKLRYRKR